MIQFFGASKGIAWIRNRQWQSPYSTVREKVVRSVRRSLAGRQKKLLEFETAMKEADNHYDDIMGGSLNEEKNNYDSNKDEPDIDDVAKEGGHRDPSVSNTFAKENEGNRLHAMCNESEGGAINCGGSGRSSVSEAVITKVAAEADGFTAPSPVILLEPNQVPNTADTMSKPKKRRRTESETLTLSLKVAFRPADSGRVRGSRSFLPRKKNAFNEKSLSHDADLAIPESSAFNILDRVNAFWMGRDRMYPGVVEDVAFRSGVGYYYTIR